MNWAECGQVYTDIRFPTKLDNVRGSRQAFALSISDLHVHMGLSMIDWASPLIDTAHDGFEHDLDGFWLRSPGFDGTKQQQTYSGGGIGSNYMANTAVSTRPALSLRID